jgi:alkyldihydroxyacetonephosphate synthase
VAFLDHLSRALPHLIVSDDPADKVAYARDLWPRHHLAVRGGHVADHKPGAIAWPTSTEDVARLVRWARASKTPLVPFGAGSGVCGGVLPREDVVVVDLKRMARWRRLDRGAPLVEVEAGHMGVPLEEGLGREGFTLGHFPSSILCSTVGGWVAARSAGQCSGYYGKIEDMIAALECVTGSGDVVTLTRRAHGPDLVPLVVGSEGTLAIVTSVALRLFPAPTARSFASWSFPTTEQGWDAMRAIFQSGLRPAVARLYDPFDAMLARRGGVKGAESKTPRERRARAPGLGGAVLRQMLRRPTLLNELLHSDTASHVLGGALLVVIFEGTGDGPGLCIETARRIVEGGSNGIVFEGDGPARRWLEHRYAVSYRQAPVFAAGAWVDTMEVAAPWSRLGALYEGVRRALGENVFVMAHFSHAYPDGCCIYFSFAGSAAPGGDGPADWERASEATYDRAWRAALRAAIEAGGTLSHHHGVGRSKAPRLPAELGAGIGVIRGLQRAFDPDGLLNPGNLVPDSAMSNPTSTATFASAIDLDTTSLLADVAGTTPLADLEKSLLARGLTLDVGAAAGAHRTVADWLHAGAPGTRDAWLDPADHVVAGFEATLRDGRRLVVRPSPRRAVGPDLAALVVGCRGRFATVSRAWLRVHPVGVARPMSPPFRFARDEPTNASEEKLLTAIEYALG